MTPEYVLDMARQAMQRSSVICSRACFGSTRETSRLTHDKQTPP